MIEGVELIEVPVMRDQRGALFKMVSNATPQFKSFGEVYFSSINPGIVKGWHLQKRMTRIYAVPVGLVRVVIYDPRSRAVEEFELGEDCYRLLVIPPNVWNSFAGLGTTPSLVADFASEIFDPAMAERRDLADPDIPYRWNLPV